MTTPETGPSWDRYRLLKEDPMKEEYRGYTIEPDDNYPYAMNRYMYYPTDEGVDHDYDGDSEGYTYCGNCKWAGTIEDAKAGIDDLLD